MRARGMHQRRAPAHASRNVSAATSAGLPFRRAANKLTHARVAAPHRPCMAHMHGHACIGGRNGGPLDCEASAPSTASLAALTAPWYSTDTRMSLETLVRHIHDAPGHSIPAFQHPRRVRHHRQRPRLRRGLRERVVLETAALQACATRMCPRRKRLCHHLLPPYHVEGRGGSAHSSRLRLVSMLTALIITQPAAPSGTSHRLPPFKVSPCVIDQHRGLPGSHDQHRFAHAHAR